MKILSFLTLIGSLYLLGLPSMYGQTNADHFSIYEDASLDDFLTSKTFDGGAAKSFHAELQEFVDHLHKKRHKYINEMDFLQSVFYKVNSKYLKHYKTPSTLQDLYRNRSYDCVTGTALYCQIFDMMDVPYQIVETTVHIYLTVEIADKLVVIESTDPLAGFISNPKKITATLKKYIEDSKPDNWSNKAYYRVNRAVHKQISLAELVGLQYHNLAVGAYNQRDLGSALVLQEKALKYYNSARLEEIMAVMLHTLSNDMVIDPVFKHKYLSKYPGYGQSVVTANRAD